MQPSLKIDDAVVAWSVLLTDGRVVTGLLVEQTYL